jgi:hypothetical protein
LEIAVVGVGPLDELELLELPELELTLRQLVTSPLVVHCSSDDVSPEGPGISTGGS